MQDACHISSCKISKKKQPSSSPCTSVVPTGVEKVTDEYDLCQDSLYITSLMILIGVHVLGQTGFQVKLVFNPKIRKITLCLNLKITLLHKTGIYQYFQMALAYKKVCFRHLYQGNPPVYYIFYVEHLPPMFGPVTIHRFFSPRSQSLQTKLLG